MSDMTVMTTVSRKAAWREIPGIVSRLRGEALLLIPFLVFVGLFEVYPLVNMAIRSLFDQDGVFTFQNYINVFTKPQFQVAIRNSLLFASAASLVGGIGGTF
ncbi:MAG: hypothetical protein ACK4OK_00735, partial [Thermoflexus sp.]